MLQWQRSEVEAKEEYGGGMNPTHSPSCSYDPLRASQKSRCLRTHAAHARWAVPIYVQHARESGRTCHNDSRPGKRRSPSQFYYSLWWFFGKSKRWWPLTVKTRVKAWRPMTATTSR